MDFVKNDRIWRTMIGADLSACMDYADNFDPHRGEIWVKAFGHAAVGKGYRFLKEVQQTRCSCAASIHLPECGYARPTVKAAVIPFDEGNLPILNVDRLPSPRKPGTRPCWPIPICMKKPTEPKISRSVCRARISPSAPTAGKSSTC